jgi:hypothetical protein
MQKCIMMASSSHSFRFRTDGGGGGGRRAAAVAASLPAVWTMSSSTYRGNVYIQGVPEILVYTFI